jgi:NAD(P)-dependent dehydrogenase (short-subunit alcohol dehydrogenase family)
MTKLLDGKVCIIAGAAAPKGIGQATARLFAEHGARLVLADRNASDGTVADFMLASASENCLAPEVIAVKCDISDRQDCNRLVDATIERFGEVDVLVNSAGIVGSGPMLDIDSDTLDQMIGVNLKGAFNLCQATLAAFVQRNQGNIVNIASLAAQRGGGLVGGAHYAAAKGGVVSLTRSIAREFGPAMAQTSMLDGLSEQQIEAIKAEIPLRRLGTARDVAGACLFLASDLSNFVTGATLDVNGGLHIH